jgi:hypothetical protein
MDDGYIVGSNTDLGTRPLGKVTFAAARSARTCSRQHEERFSITCQVSMNGVIKSG